MKAINVIREHIEMLREQVDELYNKLDRSLVIEEHWPDAFDGPGTVTTAVKGNPKTGLVFTITFANGEAAVMDLRLAPFLLWPEAVKEDIRNSGWTSQYYMLLKKLEKEVSDG